jgi:cytochrome P450
MTLPVMRPAGPDNGFFGAANLYKFQKDTLGFLTDVAETHGEIAYIKMLAFDFYLLNSPEYVYQAIIKQGSKLEKWKRQTDTWANAVGHSTLTMEGEKWKQHRRILNPSFHATTVQRYTDMIIDQTQRALDRWQDTSEQEMMFEMMRTTMSIIAEIIFSIKDLERDAAGLNQALTAVFEVLTARTTAFQQTPIWAPTPENRRIWAATRTIENFMLPLISERRRAGVDHGDILSDLIQAKDAETGEQLSDREIMNELKTLFGAGHETTALMLTWTLYLLAKNPEIQEKLQAEVDRVLVGRDPTLNDLKQLPYTEQVINESMRLFPPAWSLMVRQAKEELQFGDTRVPQGSLLLIPMWVVHRNPSVFPDPLRFDPDRFEGDWRSRFPKYAFFPFGGGPHVCVGSHLAMLEGHLMLPMMVQRYSYHDLPRAPIQLQALLTLRPRSGLKIGISKR